MSGFIPYPYDSVGWMKVVDVHLSPEALDWIFKAAQKIHQSAIDNHSMDLRVSPWLDDLTIHILGLKGEYAICQFLGLNPEEVLGGEGMLRPDRTGDIPWQGQKIEVKTSQHMELWPLNFIVPNGREFEADFGVMCITEKKRSPTVRLLGWFNRATWQAYCDKDGFGTTVEKWFIHHSNLISMRGVCFEN